MYLCTSGTSIPGFMSVNDGECDLFCWRHIYTLQTMFDWKTVYHLLFCKTVNKLLLSKFLCIVLQPHIKVFREVDICNNRTCLFKYFLLLQYWRLKVQTTSFTGLFTRKLLFNAREWHWFCVTSSCYLIFDFLNFWLRVRFIFQSFIKRTHIWTIMVCTAWP